MVVVQAVVQAVVAAVVAVVVVVVVASGRGVTWMVVAPMQVDVTKRSARGRHQPRRCDARPRLAPR